jgi:hypothetical protein
MTDNTHRKVQRGPLVSERRVLSKKELDEFVEPPARVFSVIAQGLLEDLIDRVGHQHKITVVIEPLKKEHPQSPGYMIAAKMRRP